jgi:hypothetical protein
VPRRAHPLYPRPNRRAIGIAIALAVVAHAGVFWWFSTHHDDPLNATLPSVDGGPGSSAGAGGGASGLPATSRRILQQFKILDSEGELPVENAHVRDVFGETETVTNNFGMAALNTRPGARLLIQVEKPGFAIYAEELGNVDRDPPAHTLLLKRKPVPYYIVDTIFFVRCTYCHGREGRTSGIDLTSWGKVRRSSGTRGPSVRPNDPGGSPLIRILIDSLGQNGKRTPHARATAMVTPLEVDWLTEWIRQGARLVK